MSHLGNYTLKDDTDQYTYPTNDFLLPEAGAVTKKSKKRPAASLRKAPDAPKRFKSSYICFFIAKQASIKEEIGADACVMSISKRSAEMWKALTPEERQVWDNVAEQDKQRYIMEKSLYTGPWQVPWKRLKKDPSAPKRPMSAFLYFTQGKRTDIKNKNPEMKNTEVSRRLGEMWRSLSDEGRAPYVEREKYERELYKVAIAEWRKQNAKQEEEQKDDELGMDDLHPEQMGNSYMMPYGKAPVILGPKGIPYPSTQGVASYGQKPIQVAPSIFGDDTSGIMALHNHNYDFSTDHSVGDPNGHQM